MYTWKDVDIYSSRRTGRKNGYESWTKKVIVSHIHESVWKPEDKDQFNIINDFWFILSKRGMLSPTPESSYSPTGKRFAGIPYVRVSKGISCANSSLDEFYTVEFIQMGGLDN